MHTEGPGIVLPRREAPRERICRYVCGFRTEGPSTAYYIGKTLDRYVCGFRTGGPGIAFHFDEKHHMNVLIAICGVYTRKEGPDIACHLGEKHTVNVLIVICVGSERKGPALRFTSARSTP